MSVGNLSVRYEINRTSAGLFKLKVWKISPGADGLPVMVINGEYGPFWTLAEARNCALHEHGAKPNEISVA